MEAIEDVLARTLTVIHSKDHVAFFNEKGSFTIDLPQGASIVKEIHNRNITCKSR